MVNLIYNIISSNADDGKQHKDNSNNNNIIKYLELKNDRILCLSEKNYENLIVALTNNAIDAAAASSYSSSNSTLSLTSGSSAFTNLSDQNNTCRKEESEIFRDSKADISE